MSRPRPATLRDIDEAALALPDVVRDPPSGGRPSFAVRGRTFAFARTPHKDAFDPETGEAVSSSGVRPVRSATQRVPGPYAVSSGSRVMSEVSPWLG